MTQSQMWDRMMAAGRRGAASGLEMARRYTKAFPELANGWLVLARALGGMSRFNEAKTALRQAARLIPPGERAHVVAGWGRLHEEMGAVKAAEASYKEAVVLDPCTTTYILLGAALARQGRFVEAKRQYRRAIALAKSPVKDAPDEAHYNLGLILRAEGRYEASIKEFNKAISIDPEYVLAKEALRDVEEARQMRKAG